MMTRKQDTDAQPTRYMTFQEVARELQISVESVRDKALTPGSGLAVVDVGNGTARAQWRVLRSSFQDYCERIERESAARFERGVA
jgi:hypothetical protein